MTEELRVSEVFIAPQGEGARSGQVSLFIRLQGCSAKHACATSGIVCDTEFESGRPFTPDQILDHVRTTESMPGWIVWTGGEPLDQLTPDIVTWFRSHGFRQAIETSGIRPFPREFRDLFQWIACSPKVAEHILVRHFGEPGIRVLVPAPEGEDAGDEEVAAHVHELRYVRHAGQMAPQPSLTALSYYLSPHADGFTLNQTNVQHVLDLCRMAPKWRISLQMHKVWRSL